MLQTISVPVVAEPLGTILDMMYQKIIHFAIVEQICERRATMSENEKILAESLSKVRAAIKRVTDGDLYDNKWELTKEGYEALETLEGLDLFWVCDPLIKLASQKEKEEVYEPEYPCLYKGCVFVDEFGISEIVDVDDRGIRTAKQVIPKSVFIQAYNKFIKDDIEDRDKNEGTGQ